VNKDFSVAYSPERINVGDKIHRLDNVPKIVSASNQQTLEFVADLYGSVINAEVVRASNIKVAEAAKMYENVQRDVLIALANQYSDYCREEGIDIQEVTDCAATKWNFSNVKPGLVGGHCIGVDAYYLLQRSSEKGCNQSLVNTARSINEDKVCQVTDRIVKLASSINKELCIQNVLILGFSYKPNTSDIRNTKISDLLISLKQRFGFVDCYDPLVDYIMVEKEYSIKLIDSDSLDINQYDITILAVNHDCFKDFNSKGLINITDLL
jgi:UDP-N-acetyl-D-galactosamine dehydrogenase